MQGLNGAGAVQAAIPAPPARITLFIWNVSYALPFGSHLFGFLLKVGISRKDPIISTWKKIMQKRRHEECRRDKAKRGEQRGRKTETRLEEWEEKLEQNRDSEEGAVGKEMQQSYSTRPVIISGAFIFPRLCIAKSRACYIFKES